MANYNDFIRKSPIAAKVTLDADIILSEQQHTALQIADLQAEGTLLCEVPASGIYKLEAGGQILALGKIIRRFGKSYFKIVKTYRDFGGDK